MPSWKNSFAGAYLKTEDLMGRPVRVVIESIAEEELGTDEKGKEMKLVAHFFGKSKALVLNKTKCEALELISGTDLVEAWIGLQIVLAPGRTKYQGRTVGCIDIKPGQPAGTRQQTLQPTPPPAPPPPVELPDDLNAVPVFDDEPPF